MRKLLFFVVSGLALCTGILAQPYRAVVVHGESMSPTYASGQVLLTTRADTDFQRGQAVVFQHDDETLVKRVAFLPGDRILEFKYLGMWLAPPNDFVLARLRARKMPSRYTTIPPDHLFVLGDNVPESFDSRSFGPIPFSAVEGQVLDSVRPDRIAGFAGAAELVDGSSYVTYRKLRLSKQELAHIRPIDRTGVN